MQRFRRSWIVPARDGLQGREASDQQGLGLAKEAEQDERSAAQYRTVPPSMEELEIDGILAMNAGEYENAVRDFTELITRQPDAAESRLRRAWAFERLGNDAKAMTDYEVAAALKPSDPDPRMNLGRLLDRAGDLERPGWRVCPLSSTRRGHPFPREGRCRGGSRLPIPLARQMVRVSPW